MIDGHGDDSYKYSRPITANFSSNVYSKVNLSRLKAHLCECIGEIGNYPEPEPYTLEARIASRCQLPSGAVCVTNGATEAIYLIAQTFRGTNTAIQVIGASRTDSGVHAMGNVAVFDTESRIPGDKICFALNQRLPDDVRMLWLCNPNNPTGTVADKEYMRGLIEHNPQVCFIIDQSYEFFTLCPLFSPAEAAEYPNVLLLHSMTKRYAIPGLRLGYVTGSSGLLERLRTNRMPWSVNRLAIEAGLFLLENDVPEPVDVAAYLQETARLGKALKTVGGLDVWDTQTHFMLVQLRMGKASALKEYLAREHGILIRDASNFAGLDERFFRIATQTPEENDRLVAAIEEFMAG